MLDDMCEQEKGSYRGAMGYMQGEVDMKGERLGEILTTARAHQVTIEVDESSSA